MIVKRSVDIEIAAALVQGLKISWGGFRFGKVVGVGHGYGRYEFSVVSQPSPHHWLSSAPAARNFLAGLRNMLASWIESSSCRAHQMFPHC